MVGAFSYGREQVATVSGPSANGVHAETSYALRILAIICGASGKTADERQGKFLPAFLYYRKG